MLDEYKDINKTLYSEIIAPMINAYKDGWTVWIGTPGGKNQFYDIYNKAKESPSKYYLSYLNVYETGLLDEEQIKDAIEEGTDENGDDAAFRQEYLLDWDVASKHAYFRYQIQELWKDSEGRIRPHLFNNTKPVYTAWDVGVNDYTCIVFFQRGDNGLINIIDFFKDRGHGVEYYCEKLEEMPYKYAKHFLPHDMGATDFSTGLTRQEVFESNFGRESSIVLPRINIADGIEITRNCFPLYIFDDSLSKYIETISEWGPKIGKDGLPTNTPEHCDVTDTIRYLSMALKEHVETSFDDPEATIIDYNELI